MTKVYCADISCEFNNGNWVCTQKKIAFSFHSVLTLYEGRQEFNRCKMYQKSKMAIELENQFNKCFKELEEDENDDE